MKLKKIIAFALSLAIILSHLSGKEVIFAASTYLDLRPISEDLSISNVLLSMLNEEKKIVCKYNDTGYIVEAVTKDMCIYNNHVPLSEIRYNLYISVLSSEVASVLIENDCFFDFINRQDDGDSYYVTQILYHVRHPLHTARIANTLKRLDLDKKSDFEKIDTIYNFVKNMEYPYYLMFKANPCSDGYYDQLIGNSSCGALKSNFALCGGRAALFYQLCRRVNIDVRCVFGDSLMIEGPLKDTRASHAWNIVKLDGIWYHVDCTNALFLKGNKNYLKSIELCLSNFRYLTLQNPDFYRKYPVSDFDYGKKDTWYNRLIGNY